MVTIHREHGLRFIIYLDDHEPAHIHVIGEGEAKINLIGADGAPELVRTMGFTAAALRRIMRVVGAQQRVFLDQWRHWHG